MYVPLHTHSDASLLDGLSRVDDIVSRAKEIGAPAIAITDHYRVGNLISLYDKAKKAGIKPILGCEIGICEQDATVKNEGNRKLMHLVIWAHDNQGWENLLKIITESNNKDHFYYNPRLNLERLVGLTDGIIGSSACIVGVIARKLFTKEGFGEATEAKDVEFVKRRLEPDWLEIGIRETKRCVDIFGEGNFYLEAQNSGMIAQTVVRDCMREISKETGVPVIPTDDSHFPRQNDFYAHEALITIQTRDTLDRRREKVQAGESVLFNDNSQYYIHSHEDMTAKGFTEEEIANTVKIADRCNVEIELDKPCLPKFSIPKDFDRNENASIKKISNDNDKYLYYLCQKGFMDRGIDKLENKEEYIDRLLKEFKIISDYKLSDYFLVVSDYTRWAREQKIMTGAGRGSAGGSLLCYLVGITNIDPIKYELIFERFLNEGRLSKERVKLPDIDIDFDAERRDEVAEYIKETYGADKVAKICTFGSLKAKAALKDVFRISGHPASISNSITKGFPDDELKGDDYTLEKAIEFSQDIARMASGEYKKEFLLAQKLEGIKKSQGTHAAGVIIMDQPITNKIPLVWDAKGKCYITGFEMNDCEKCGGAKVDLLGLKLLTAFDKAQTEIRKVEPKFDINDIPMEDEYVYAMISEGNTHGVFQLETSFAQRWVKKIKPKNLRELSATVALIRPGCIDCGETDRYVRVKNREEEPYYIVPQLKEITEETYSVVVFQEQILKIAQKLAGFTLVEADRLREAIGKKKIDLMKKLKPKFIEGCIKNSIDENSATVIFENIEKSARYAFNLSHSMAYAMLGYQSAYIKFRYPEVFYLTWLSCSYLKQKPLEEISNLVNDARLFDIKVLPPSVFLGNKEFAVEENKIRFGLSHVKGLGKANIKKMSEIKFVDTNWYRILPRLLNYKLNKNIVESLIKSGAFDDCEMNRRVMIAEHALLNGMTDKDYDLFIRTFKGEIRKGIDSIKGHKKYGSAAKEIESIRDEDILVDVYREMEELTLGISLSMDEALTDDDPSITHTCLDAFRAPEDEYMTVRGYLKSMRKTKTKTGRNPGQEMAFITITDNTYELDMVVFPSVFSEACYKNNCLRDIGKELLIINCKKNDRGIMANTIREVC